MSKKIWETNLILKVRAGSHAYGTATSESDIDTRGIFIAPKEYVIGLKRIDQVEDKKSDIVIYELTKFVNLALQCNPNIIEILYSDPSDILFINEYGQRLVDAREIFISKAARFRFGGYAFAQLHRIKRHKRWIDAPPNKPTQDKFVRKTSIQTFEGKRIEFTKFFEQEYDAALKEFNHYLEWKANRNEDRAELETKFSFDTKHALHLVRLMRMGCEILEGKGVIVRRPDATELLDIRNGKLSYDEIVAIADGYEKKLEVLYESSKLPKTSDFNKANGLVMKLYLDFWDRM